MNQAKSAQVFCPEIVNKLFTISGQNRVDIITLICYHVIVYKNCIGIQSFAKNNLRRNVPHPTAENPLGK